jgi:hypothetical protein
MTRCPALAELFVAEAGKLVHGAIIDHAGTMFPKFCVDVNKSIKQGRNGNVAGRQSGDSASFKTGATWL